MADLHPGDRLGPFEILDRLGAGGMGELYRACDVRLNRPVAIKFLHSHLNASTVGRERFEREARSIAALTHPHICTLHDVGEHEGVTFIVMELLQGRTLATRLIATRDGLPVNEALTIAAQVAEALSFAHKHQIVHRDIKPSNIMLTPTGVKLLDFGLARLCDGDETTGAHGTGTVLTADRTMLGTLPYMPPEQIDGRADHRSDIFAFGAVLFEILTGRRPFDGESSSAIIAAIVQQEPPPLTSLRPDISPSLDRVVRRCLAKDPDKRWQSAADLADELRWIGNDHVNRQPETQEGRPLGRRLALVAALGVALVASAFLAGWGLRSRAAATDATGSELPTWLRLTFGDGHVHNARFAPDGQTIVYSASWDGKPFQVFSTTALSPESRALDLPPAGLLAVSRTGQLALALSCRYIASFGGCNGTLARVPLLGGAPRPLAENVHSADWGPNDTIAAAVSERLEAPLGTPLSDQDVHLVRASPDGHRIASAELEPGDNTVSLVIRRGQSREVLLRGASEISGLAWSSDGTAIFVSGLGHGDSGDSVSRIEMDGKTRTVLRSLPRIRVLDASPTALLVDRGETMTRTWIRDPDSEHGRRDLSWLGNSVADALSHDGQTALLTIRGNHLGRATKLDFPIYVRPTSGGPATLLGTGYGHALSDDGRWALTSTREGRNSKLVLHPLGPGSARTLERGGLDLSDTRSGTSNVGMTSASFAGPNRIAFEALDDAGAVHIYVQSIDGGPPVRVVHEPGRLVSPVAPDGEHFISQRPDGSLWLATFTPQEASRLRFTLQPNQLIRQWSHDGLYVFVLTLGNDRRLLTKVDTKTGRIRPHAEIMADHNEDKRFGTFVRLSRDGRTIVYTSERTDSDLFLVEGLNRQ